MLEIREKRTSTSWENAISRFSFPASSCSGDYRGRPNQSGHANLGIDFAGGTGVQLKFDKAVRIDEARKALESQG